MTIICRLISRPNSQGKGNTWWIQRPDGSIINTFHASSGRDRYRKEDMESSLKREQGIWESSRFSGTWEKRRSL